MNGRSLTVCTLAGMIALFAWQTVSNAVLPWHQKTIHTFTDTSAASVRAFRAQAPANGVYWNPHGIVAMVSPTPDYIDQQTLLGKMLARQIAIDLFVAAMLCILVARLRDARPSAVAAAAGFGALAVSTASELSAWNWYGYGIDYVLINVVDTSISFFIAGWVIAWLARRMNGAPAAVELPTGAGYGATATGSLVH